MASSEPEASNDFDGNLRLHIRLDFLGKECQPTPLFDSVPERIILNWKTQKHLLLKILGIHIISPRNYRN